MVTYHLEGVLVKLHLDCSCFPKLYYASLAHINNIFWRKVNKYRLQEQFIHPISVLTIQDMISSNVPSQLCDAYGDFMGLGDSGLFFVGLLYSFALWHGIQKNMEPPH